MTDEREWFTSAAGRRITAQEISVILGISRRTATNRLNEGLSADDLIALARQLDVSPIDALVELGKLTNNEVIDYIDGDGTLLSTASQEQLIKQLAEDSLSLSDRIEIGAAAKALSDGRDELAARRAARDDSNTRGPSRPERDHDGTVREFDWAPGTYAADSSPDERAGREAEGSDPID